MGNMGTRYMVPNRVCMELFTKTGEYLQACRGRLVLNMGTQVIYISPGVFTSVGGS